MLGFPARSNAVMLNSTWPSAWLAFTITLAFAIWPVMFIAYVEFKSMISALERFSFAVIVMFRASPKVASEVSWALLLYMVRFETSWICAIYCKVSTLAFDLAENNLTVTQDKSKLFKPYNRSHKSNYLKSNHIQQQRPRHLTCNLG